MTKGLNQINLYLNFGYGICQVFRRFERQAGLPLEITTLEDKVRIQKGAQKIGKFSIV